LRNAKYEHGDLSLQPSPNEDVFNEYIFMRSPKFVETAVQRVDQGFKIDLGKIYPEKSVDIAETISNLFGKKIIKITRDAVELQNFKGRQSISGMVIIPMMKKDRLCFRLL